MKKINASILLFLPSFAFAADKVIGENVIDGDIFDFLARTRGFLIGITGSLAALFIIFAGLKYISAGGNQEKLESAKKTLTYAILGVIFFLLSNVVFAFLTGKEFLGLFK